MKVLNWEERNELESIILEYLDGLNKDNPCKNYFGLIINQTDVRIILKTKELIEWESETLKLNFPKIEKLKFKLSKNGLLGMVSGLYEGTCFKYWIKGKCYNIRLEGEFEIDGLEEK